MSKSRLFSGKIKKKTGSDLDASRYDYLDVSQAEPDLGIPTNNNSLLVGQTDGTRAWVSTLTSLTVAGDIYAEDIYSNGQQVVTTATINQFASDTTITAGTDTFVSTSTGDVTIWNASTLQSVSDRGSTTTNAIRITNTSSSDSTDAGALVVSGGVGIGGALHVESTSYIDGLRILTDGDLESFTSTNNVFAFLNTASSISTNTGAMTVVGGVGIGENLHVGGQAHFFGNAVFEQGVVFNSSATFVSSTNTVYTDNIIEVHKLNTGSWTVNDGKDIGLVGYYYDTVTAAEKKFFFGFANEDRNFEFYVDGTETAPGVFAGAYGNLKVNKIVLASTETSTSSITGALVVPGGIGVQGNVNIKSTGKLTVGEEIATADLPDVPAQFSGNVNSYFQVNNQNINGGALASSDYVATANNGNDSNYYADFGIASSGYNYPDFSVVGANDAYLLSQGGNLVLATGATGKKIEFWTDGFGAPNQALTYSTTGTHVMTMSTDGVKIYPQTISTSFTTGALVVLGGVGISGVLSVSGPIIQDGVAIGYGYTGSLGYTGSRGYTGSQGEQGEVGFTGSFGFQGFTGSQGYTGSGYTGSAGFTGSVGFVGSRGIGFTGSEGYTGSVGFVGSQGDLGYTGSEGIGFTGSQGDKGYTGSEGYTGSKGFTGSAGFTGSQGDAGSLGYTGSQGDIGYTGSASTASGYTGSIGFTGSAGQDGTSVTIIGSTSTYAALPDPYLGNIGDGYITADNGHLNVWSGTVWNDVGAIIGFTGSKGYTGSAGADGIIGVDGFTGSQGYTGSAGENGTNGYTGSQGEIGYTGSEGFTGSQGYVGSTGDLGYTGSAGAGFTGSQGDTGYTGSEGYTGSAGAGFTGSQGINGFNGSNGYTGSAGTDGYTGSRGESSYTYSNNAPFNPAVGDRWFNTNYGIELVWTDDGNSTQWVEIAASGYLGQLGYTGSQGEQGIDGAYAAVGYTGSASTTPGFTGSQGDLGDTGPQGDIGYTGSQGIKGDTGFTGSQGYTGSQGNRGGLQYLFDPTVTASGIAGGRIRFNNTVTSSVGEIYINKLDIYGFSNENYIISWDDSSTPDNKGQISFKKNVNVSTATVVYNVIGSITNETDYLMVPVSYLSGSLSGFGVADQMAVEYSRTGDLGYTGSFGYTGSLGGFNSIQTINLQTGTAYTLAGSDVGRLVELNNASGTTVTVPAESAVDFVIGQRIDLQQLTTGPVIVVGDVGVVVNSVEYPMLNNQFSIATLIKTGSNEWSFIAPAATGYTGSTGFTGYTGSQGVVGFVGSRGAAGGTPFVVAVTNEVGSVVVGNGRVTFRAPYALTLSAIPRASLTTVSSSGLVTVDIKVDGTTILGTDKLSIDANEKTSTTALTPTTLATTSVADDAEFTIDVTAAGTGAAGLKVTLYYLPA